VTDNQYKFLQFAKLRDTSHTANTIGKAGNTWPRVTLELLVAEEVCLWDERRGGVRGEAALAASCATVSFTANCSVSASCPFHITLH